MPLLPAQHAVWLLAGLDFLPNEIRAIGRPLYADWHSFVSLSPIWNCGSRGTRFEQLSLPALRPSTTFRLLGNTGYRLVNRTMDYARAVRLCGKFAGRQIGCTVWRPPDSVRNRMRIGNPDNWNADSWINLRGVFGFTE